jgi:hypothetical protein
MADLLRLAQDKKETADSGRIKRRQKNVRAGLWLGLCFLWLGAEALGDGLWNTGVELCQEEINGRRLVQAV